MMLFYLLDKKSGTEYNPMFCPNKDVALRNLAIDLKTIREKNLYSALSVWSDSDLMCLDIGNDLVANVVPEFRNFFNVEVKDENKNVKE